MRPGKMRPGKMRWWKDAASTYGIYNCIYKVRKNTTDGNPELQLFCRIFPGRNFPGSIFLGTYTKRHILEQKMNQQLSYESCSRQCFLHHASFMTIFPVHTSQQNYGPTTTICSQPCMSCSGTSYCRCQQPWHQQGTTHFDKSGLSKVKSISVNDVGL